jgi:transcription elongation factor Elf1
MDIRFCPRCKYIAELVVDKVSGPMISCVACKQNFSIDVPRIHVQDHIDYVAPISSTAIFDNALEHVTTLPTCKVCNRSPSDFVKIKRGVDGLAYYLCAGCGSAASAEAN